MDGRENGRRRGRGVLLTTDIVMALALVSMFFLAVYVHYSTSPEHESRYALCQSAAQAFVSSNFSGAVKNVPSQSANETLQQFVDSLPAETGYLVNVSVYDGSLAFVGAAAAGSRKPLFTNSSWHASKRMAVRNAARSLLYADVSLDCFETR